ncbi:nuclear transport factor 2 family protein [Anaerofustis sp.]|uniref:nuclear transport factor 2 family protein n=1 Tax=Anaerofustis sp. TaxID=1872517 RepID=UPI0025B90E7A|nr:nuclear transport factor 2 family protein [Anaerofustis sp.]
MNNNFLEAKAIEQLVEKYFNAVYAADIDTLKKIFHEKAGMSGYLGEDVIVGTPEIFYEDLSSKPSMKSENIDCKCVISDLEVIGGIAKVTLYVDGFFGFATIKDLFHLIKVDDEWRIIQKTFTTV